MKDKTIVQILDQLEMVGFIKSNGTQCRFVSLVSSTAPKLRKGCPFHGVRKVSRKNGIVNANFNTSVRNRIAEKLGVTLSEVEYQNGEVWYEHLQTVDGHNLPLVQHKDESKRAGKYYLQYYPHAAMSKYVLPNGEEIPEAQLKPWFYKQSERPDFKPVVISIDLTNIKELRASGVIMQAEDLAEAEEILAR